MCCGWSKLRLGTKCSFLQCNCYFRKQLPAFRLQDQDVSAVTKLQALVIKQHTTKELVNLLSNQYTDYQTNTPLLLICNYAIFHLITHNYKSALFHTLKSYESHTSTVHLQIHHFTSLHDISPQWKSIPLKPTLSQWVFQTPSWREFLVDQVPNQWRICTHLHSSFQKAPSSFVFNLFFFALFITVSISWNNLFATLVPPFLCPGSSLRHTFVSLSWLAKFSKICAKVWTSQGPFAIGANSASYWYTLPGKRGPKHPHELAVHNSNTLASTFSKANKFT